MATREEMAYRRAEIARDVAEGRSPRSVAEHWGITPQRVGQIVKRVQRDEQRERCASGQHADIYRGEMTIWQDGLMDRVPVAWCQDCGERVEP